MWGLLALWFALAGAAAAGSVLHELTHYAVARAAGARNVRLHWPYVYYEAPDHVARFVNRAPLLVATGWLVAYGLWHGLPSLGVESLVAAALFVGYTAFGGHEDRTLTSASEPVSAVEAIWMNTDRGSAVLASDVTVADSWLARARGMIGRGTPRKNTALVFPFPTVKARGVHMLGVRYPLDVVWVADGEVTAVKRCRPWFGHGRAECDTIVEVPAGTAADLEPGDTLQFDHA